MVDKSIQININLNMKNTKNKEIHKLETSFDYLFMRVHFPYSKMHNIQKSLEYYTVESNNKVNYYAH